MLTIMDEFSRECLAIDVARKLTSEDVLERLCDLFVHRGVPEYIRSDNGSGFTAECVREWLGRVGVKTLFIEPRSPWESRYVESINGRLRDKLQIRERFENSSCESSTTSLAPGRVDFCERHGTSPL